MKSKESLIAAQVRLNQWTQEVQGCMNRPKDMTVDEWCAQHNIKKANYYWRLKRVRQACLEQVETSAENFVELPTPIQHTMSFASLPITTNDNSCTVAVLRTSSGISIELKECASAEFVKNLMGALTNA